jgi:hypothetical protein
MYASVRCVGGLPSEGCVWVKSEMRLSCFAAPCGSMSSKSSSLGASVTRGMEVMRLSTESAETFAATESNSVTQRTRTNAACPNDYSPQTPDLDEEILEMLAFKPPPRLFYDGTLYNVPFP